MKISAFIEQIKDVGKGKADRQTDFNIAEAWNLWNLLIARYDVLETTRVLINFVEDTDLKLILEHGKKVLQDQAVQVEKIMQKHQVPSPEKPPESLTTAHIVEIVTDKYVFRRVFGGIQTFLPVLTIAFTQSTSSTVREIFRKFLHEEIELYDKFFEYGIFKGWVCEPPHFKG